MNNDFICTPRSLRSPVIEWGVQVKKILDERGMRQIDLIPLLKDKGITIKPLILSRLLTNGYCALTSQRPTVIAINEILDITTSKLIAQKITA